MLRNRRAVCAGPLEIFYLCGDQSGMCDAFVECHGIRVAADILFRELSQQRRIEQQYVFGCHIVSEREGSLCFVFRPRSRRQAASTAA